MEARLKSITRCLTRAIEELEKVSVSEKAVKEVNLGWMIRFHQGIVVPRPFAAERTTPRESCPPSQSIEEPATDAAIKGSEAETTSSELDVQDDKRRWEFLRTKWLPLLDDLRCTLAVLDREENELLEVEAKANSEARAKAERSNPDGDASIDHDDARAQQQRTSSLPPPPRPPKGLLSLRDYTVIHSALEIAVHWGLCPQLESGVGVFGPERRPRSRAIKISRRLLDFWKSGDNVPGDGQTEYAAGNIDENGVGTPGSHPTDASCSVVQLVACVEAIQGVVFTEQFMPMLLPHYLPDLLAARLQLAYGQGSAGGSPGNASCQSGGTSSGQEEKEKISLRALLRAVGPRQVMAASRQLLSRGNDAPLWLRQQAGAILSQIVLRPGGVQAALEVYLASAGGENRSGAGAGAGAESSSGTTKSDVGRNEMRACLRVARLLAVPPKSVKPAEYVSRVGPQLMEMLHYEGQQEAMITRVVVMIIGRLSESMAVDTRRLILSVLLGPLTAFWDPRCVRRASPKSSPPTPAVSMVGDATATGVRLSSASIKAPPGTGVASGQTASLVAMGAEIASEEALERCVEDVDILLTASPPPPALLRLLSRMGIALPLFRLYCFSKTSKTRNAQSTQRCLTALLSRFAPATAACNLLAGLLPATTKWGAREPRFCPGPTGGALLVSPGERELRVNEADEEKIADVKASGFANAVNSGAVRGGSSGVTGPPSRDEGLLGVEDALRGLGLDPETLRLVAEAGGARERGEGSDIDGAGSGEVMFALDALRAAESKAQHAADLLLQLGEDSVVAGKVFDLLLRKYLSLRDDIAARASREASEAIRSASPSTARTTEAEAESLEVSGTEHAVMAAIVVLADKFGARLFGSGLQVLSCIRLVLEHEVPSREGEDTASGSGNGNVRAGGGFSDAASRIARVEADEAGKHRDEVNEDDGGVGLTSPMGGGAGETLCSVVLGLLTTLLELGEDRRPAEEEQELRFMIRPLKVLAAGHHSTEVSEMSAMLCATIMSRELTPEQRQQERARLKIAVDGKRAEKSHRDRMLDALDAAEEDLQNESPPMRARGVVTLTRVLRATSEGGERDGSDGAEKLDTVVAERLLETYARMAGDLDSYVYLAAVQGMAALADSHPKWCIPRLVAIFAALPPSASPPGSLISEVASPVSWEESSPLPPPLPPVSQGSPPSSATLMGSASTTRPTLSLSQRLKIGEAVVLSARRCGEAMPKYARYYVNAFICGARERTGLSMSTSASSSLDVDGVDHSASKNAGSFLGNPPPPTPSSGREDTGSTAGDEASLEWRERAHFRASCLSNLAEVCELLRWSLGRFSQDVVDLGAGVLSMETGNSEEARLARRGSAFLLSRVLQGAGGEVLQIIPAEQLRIAYRALKRTAGLDKDEVTRSHARNGLSALETVILGQLFVGNPGGVTNGLGVVRDLGSGAGSRGVGEGKSSGDQGSADGSHHPGISVL